MTAGREERNYATPLMAIHSRAKNGLGHTERRKRKGIESMSKIQKRRKAIEKEKKA